MSERVIENIRQRWHGPCSACGDGDVNLEFHSHEPKKQAIVIDLPRLESLMRAYVAECVPNVNDRLAIQLRLSAFLVWVRRKQERGNVG